MSENVQPERKMDSLMGAVSPAGIRLAKTYVWPDNWVEHIGLKIDGHDFSYEGREYLRDIIRDHHPHRAIRKSAQMGATVISLVSSLFWWSQWDWNVMYLLPVKVGTIAFSQGRIQPMIDSTAWLKSRLQAVDNANHKRTSKANFYVRGTNILTELQEVPVDAMVFDEYDKMRMKNLPMAHTRMDASKWKWKLQLSTPTTPNFGIDREFGDSDKRYWYIKCPFCSTAQTLEWDTHVKVGNNDKDTVLECEHCHKAWPHDKIIEASDETGHWVVTDEQHSDVHGYQINQLFSPTRTVNELAKIYFRGLDDPDAMRELYNSALGLPYVVEGDRLTEDVLDECCDGEPHMKGYGPATSYAGERLYIGVDVGKVLHVTASTRHEGTGKLIKRICSIMSWAELHSMLDNLDDFICVIDRFPETTKVQELALRFWGRVFACTYRQNSELAEWIYPTDRVHYGEVKADRTLALDFVNNTYYRRQRVLPRDMRTVGENEPSRNYNGWYRQMMSSVRVSQPDKKGNMVARYESVDGKDHWHHAEVYETLASLFATPALPPASEIERETITADELGIGAFDAGFVLEDGFDSNDLDLGGW